MPSYRIISKRIWNKEAQNLKSFYLAFIFLGIIYIFRRGEVGVSGYEIVLVWLWLEAFSL